MAKPEFFQKISVFFKLVCLLIIFSFIIFNAPLINAFTDDDASEEAFFKVEEQIVVSASKRAQKLSDAPVAISVITADDIKMYGAQSIAEVLRMVPGVYVQETTNGQQDVAIRGLTNGPKEAGAFASYSRNILVMIDGRSYFNDVFGGTFWEFLPITVDDIDRIEVVRGPASALFGANAVTGVINIITKDYKKTAGFYVSSGLVLNAASTSKLDDNRFGNLTSIRYGQDGSKFSYRISTDLTRKYAFDNMSYNHTYKRYEENRHSLLASPDAGFPLNPDYPKVSKKALDAYRISSFMQYKFNDDALLNLQLGRSEGSSVNLTGTSGDLMICNYDNFEQNVIKLTYQWKDLKVALSNINGILGDYAKTTKGTEDDQDGMSWNSTDLDIQNVFQISDNDILVAGINWREVKSRADDVYFRDMKEKEQRFIAGFFNNELKLTDNLKWIVGTRWDKYDTPDKAKFSPQSILFYKPKDEHTVRLMYSQAIRAPFIADLFTNAQFSAGTLPGGGLAPIIRLIPNENLNPMTIKSYELGYSTIFKKLNLDVNLYHYQTKDMIAYNVDTHDSLSWHPLNPTIYIGGTAIPLQAQTASALDLSSVNLQGKFKANGLELGMNYNLSKSTRLFGSYSYQNAKFQDRDYKGTPSQLATIGTFNKFSNGWSFSGTVNYVSSSEVSITNVMDQTLAQINKDLSANAGAFVLARSTDLYKDKYLKDGAYIYEKLGGNVVSIAFILFSELAAIMT
ncbi:MAG TPA: TonB-dependent receptor, partial [bacterium]|nr:TonB-dependent receptor [bacterium]